MSSSASNAECAAFLAAQGTEPPPGELGSLAAALDASIAAAVDAWPDLRHDRVGFAAFLGERVPSDVDPIDALRRRALDELYLVFACLAGDAQANQVLEERYLKALVGLLIHRGISPEVARDTVQQVRIRLLTGARPVLRAYNGVGALKGWLRVTTLRDAIRAQRKGRALAGEEVSEALADAASDPALQYQRRLYQDEFRTAFGDAVASLTVRERNLLKQTVLFGATVDDLGALYQVHRATAARWIAAARERLAESTRQRMIERLRLDSADYDSILKLIHSQLDVSIQRVLGGDPPC